MPETYQPPWPLPSSDAPADGLSWTWQLDFEALTAALNEPAPWDRAAAGICPSAGDPAPVPGDAVPGAPVPGDAVPGDAGEAEPDEMFDAMAEGRVQEVPLSAVAGRIAEALPPGPDLAAWLANGQASELDDGALAGMAASYRRLASWAQAGELAVVAQLASRSAAADERIGVDEDGRPARLPDEASAQVSLALTMSQTSASWWSDLAVTLTWRLSATGVALRSGQIDLTRARLIAEATAALDEETARLVESRVLPTAGDKTTAQLRAALRRAVIAADPRGAERRREEAERRSRVCLFPDQEGTASLTGYNLPSVRAAAAMARISALARALQASGATGGIDLLRAHVFVGLLLGTLPYIPPADGGPTEPPPADAGPEDAGPADAGPADAGPADAGPEDAGPADAGPEDAGSEDAGSEDGGPRYRGERSEDRPRSQTGAGPARGSDAGLSPEPTEPTEPCEPELSRLEPNGRDPAFSRDGPATGPPPDPDEEGWPVSRPPPEWPAVVPFLPSGPAAMGNLRPAGGGLLDLQLPWSTLTGKAGEAGQLGRIGPITPAQARSLADVAAADPEVLWRIIVTSRDGKAVAVTRVPRAVRTSQGSSSHGLVRRVTLTISQDCLATAETAGLPSVATRALRAATLAAERAAQRAETDAANGGCTHEQASAAYRPPPRLREFVAARDVTCRFVTCRQPLWRCDLDHSVPFDRGGRTCSCNLGGLCRFHHQIKQHRGWQLTQPVPGTFAWTTPAGRVYVIEPDRHAA